MTPPNESTPQEWTVMKVKWMKSQTKHKKNDYKNDGRNLREHIYVLPGFQREYK
jgi:hypothetical protein